MGQSVTSAPEAVHTPEAPAPVGPYSQAVLAGGWLYCSGQVALDPRSGELLGGGDVALETQQVLRNLQAVLGQAGATAAQVVRTTVYLVDLADFSTVNGLYAEVFGQGVAPARVCVQVAALPLGARVEIDAVACLL
jgi:2-iminobutanoate/2-iminopropanoate deaminase